MRYDGLADYVTACTVNAIERVGEDTDPSVLLALSDRVVTLAEGGSISEEQFDLLRDAMLEKTTVEIPPYVEPTTPDGLTLSDLADAMAELSGVVSDQGASIEISDGGLADLSEMVSSIMPRE